MGGLWTTDRPLKTLVVLSTVAWLGAVTYLSTVPRIPEIEGIPRGYQGEVGHFAAHAVLAALLFMTLHMLRGSPLSFHWTAIIAAGGAFIYALALEGVQALLPSRYPSLSDVVVNGLGAAVGTFSILVWFHMPLPRPWAVGTAAAASFAAAVLLTGWTIVSDPSLPRVGDHSHARYAIEICGARLPPLAGSPGQIHTHGDGLIHIHPFDPEHAGRNVNLALFIETAGGSLGDGYLALPYGEIYRNGDLCAAGRPGRLNLIVNGQEVTPIPTYIPRNRDIIVIAFGAEE